MARPAVMIVLPRLAPLAEELEAMRPAPLLCTSRLNTSLEMKRHVTQPGRRQPR